MAHHTRFDLRKQRIIEGKRKGREFRFNQGDGPVLHLSGGIPLRVDVGNFLQLESAFQREGEGMAAPQIEEAVRGRIQRGQHLCRFPHGGQGILDLLRQAVQGGERSLTLEGGDGTKTLKVNIPAGVKDGAKLRLAGQGYDSPNGGPKGDLYLRIRFAPHSLFHVDGTDLTYEVRIAPWEAVLGAKVKVPTLDGNVELSIPAGTGSGKKMRLRGKGLGPAKSRGDLYVRVGIDAPKDLTPKQRELWEALAAEK